MHIVGDSMKAHILEENKTTPLNLGEGTLFAKKDGEYHKVCDTVECDETHIDDDIIKVALSGKNMIIESNFFITSFVFAD